MKTKQWIRVLFVFIFLAGVAQPVEAQFLERLKKHAKNKIKKEAENRTTRRIDKKIDESFDEVENTIDGKKSGKRQKTRKTPSQNNNNNYEENTNSDIYPPDGATNVPIPVTFKWKAMNDNNFEAIEYELYLEEGDEGMPHTMLAAPSNNKYTCKNLKPNTTYVWQYVGKSSDGEYQPGGSGVFTTGNGKKAPKAKAKSPTVVWSKFDFVPGDEVIFEDMPDPMEENGEFPSRWDLISGQVEIAEVDGETVMMFLDGGSIVPYLKNANKDYLPDVFTIEFDFYRPKGGNRLSFYLSDRKNQKSSDSQEFEVFPWRVDAPDIGYVNHPERDYSYCKNGCWTHISLAYTKGKLKVYIDDTRVVNVPHYKYNPTGFTFYPYFASAKDNQAFYAKNFRIAKGGVKYYKRVMQDGKIIVNGIRFDVGKTTLKPESMGPINKIYKLMTKKPDLKFSVEGHTDSDGDDNANQTLSEGRAKVVMEKLVEMGISKDRLSSKGWGESKPIAENNTPEGKANNRRVEFVVVK